MRFVRALTFGSLAALGVAPLFANDPSGGLPGGLPGISPAGKAAAQESDQWRAPDGELGLRPNRDTIGLFRFARGEEDIRFLRSLWALPREVRLSAQLAMARHRVRGDFVLVRERLFAGPVRDPIEQLVRLHAAFAALAGHPSEHDWGRAEAEAFARLFFDDAFHLRAGLLEGLEFELRELGQVQALLMASGRGVAALGDSPEVLGSVCRRGDLAAARLRQLERDLRLIAEPVRPRADEPEHPDRERLASWLARGESAKLLAEYPKLIARVELARERMRANLKTPEFDSRAKGELARRRSRIQRGKELLDELALLVPTTAEGHSAPGDIGALSHSERYARAVVLGQSAAAVDPLQPRIAYLTGLAVEFKHGTRLAAPYYDRFLVLRGIRFYDSRTFEGRTLTPEEERAMAAIRERQ